MSALKSLVTSTVDRALPVLDGLARTLSLSIRIRHGSHEHARLPLADDDSSALAPLGQSQFEFGRESAAPSPVFRTAIDSGIDGRLDLVFRELSTTSSTSARTSFPGAADLAERGAIVRDTLQALIHAACGTSRSAIRAQFFHNVMHNVSAITANLGEVLRILGHASAKPVGADSAIGVTLAPQDQSDVLDMLHACYNLATQETVSATNYLAQYAPTLIPGAQRREIVAEHPLSGLTDVLPAFRMMAKGRRIDIDFDEDAADTSLRVRLDRWGWRRALSCVLSNAVKYSFAGHAQSDADGPRRERAVRIRFSPRHDASGSECSLVIQNYGYGFDPDERLRIFEPGYRGRHVRDEIPYGTGLGLGEARRIVDEFGGRLSIESARQNPDAFLTTLRLVLRVH